jgi:hypothetical protein
VTGFEVIYTGHSALKILKLSQFNMPHFLIESTSLASFNVITSDNVY